LSHVYVAFCLDADLSVFSIEELTDSALAEFDKRFPAPICTHVFTVPGGRCTECGAVMPEAFTADLQLRPILTPAPAAP
jgi:hypothetical protein